VDAVERVALSIELALRGVQVLRLRIRAKRPCPESLHPPAPVAYGAHDPSPKQIVGASLAPLLRQSRRRQLRDREARGLPPREHLVPRARRVADPEGPQDFLPQPAPRQVIARLARLHRLPQVGRVELRRSLEQLDQAPPPPAGLLRPWIGALALDLDPVAVGQRLDGIGKR